MDRVHFAGLIALLLLSLSVLSDGHVDRVGLSDDGKGFVLDPSAKAFLPWGFNYGAHDKLLDDDWNWAAIQRDFDAMHGLGANVVRVHLQVARFMEAPDRANTKTLDQFSRLIDFADRTGLYLDVTGLGCYRTSDVPKWYDALSEQERWAVQGRF